MAPFVLISCEKPNEGLGFDQVIGELHGFDTLVFPVVGYTLNQDSLLVALNYDDQRTVGGYSGNRLVGALSDGVFGQSRARFAAQLILQQVSPDFGANPVVDSVNLLLTYAGYYGDTTQPMDISVREITESLDRGRNFYSNFNPQIGPSQLGGIVGLLPRPNTPSIIEGDTVAPTLKIPLGGEFFKQKIIDNAGNFTSNENLVEEFKGIVVESSSSDGSILYFNLGNANSRLVIYYHNDEDDDQKVELNFSQNKSTVPIHFNLFEHDYKNAPTAFAIDNQNTEMGEAAIYVQAMGGVFSVLKIPGLDTLAGSEIVVNRAAIDIFQPMMYPLETDAPSRLELRSYKNDTLGSQILDFDPLRSASGGDGALRKPSAGKDFYRINLTQHVFDILNGAENQPLALLPQRKSTEANRVVLQGGRGTDCPLRLIVYYTKL